MQQNDQENLQPQKRELYHKLNKKFYHNKQKRANSIMTQEEIVLP
jgi:hypothetical protein